MKGSQLPLTQHFTGQECCWQGLQPGLQSTEAGGCSSITQPSPGGPLTGAGFRKRCSCCHLVQGWPSSGLQPCPTPHVTIKMNPPVLETVDLHYNTSQQDFPAKIVMEIDYSDDRNPCYKYPGSGKPHFPAACTHMHRD